MTFLRVFCRSYAACVLAIALGIGAHAQGAPAASATADMRKVETVDLFGYGGWDGDDPHTAAVRKQVGTRVGAEINMNRLAAFRRQVQGDVVATAGKPATDVAVICCGASGGVSVFVGVEGAEAVPLEQQATPTGDDTLPPEALALYESEVRAVQPGSVPGAASGPAPQPGADAREAQDGMRAFAAAHMDVVVRVLRRSGQVQQRRAAARLLGFGPRSPAQMRALADALGDDDEGVRGNAARALTELAAGGPLQGMRVEQLLGLLYSGIFSDRVNATALLLQLSAKRDPKLLRTLEDQALPPLIEGAEWQGRAQALPFTTLLGRVVGMQDDPIASATRNGVGEIVRRAKALEARSAKR